MNATANSKQRENLSEAVRQALRDILRNEPHLVYDALEDAALARAIEEGMQSGPASRDEVFAKLQAAGR